MALPILDILHRGVVYSLLGISAYSIFVGVYGHAGRKAALVERNKASDDSGTAETGNRTFFSSRRRRPGSRSAGQEEIALARAAQGAVPSKTA
ncbi:hypothetical protein B0H17DRAFT_1213154 [Mycena rosella]|uniref:Uncharacterized protein n=1 Tax=Mycena rosella TaxID=1033263 RepID=A0AAD7CT86_MYCRO|nr:hypothetical protein B0H17DRAFT_1213154 [Mycena rosella]